MNVSIENHLSYLYEDSTDLVAAIADRIEKFRRQELPAPPAGTRPTEKDSILITYADQILPNPPNGRDGSPPPSVASSSPLRTLTDFLTTHAEGIITAVHLLPFYPSSSDDGFSVMDYTAVDPSVGTWDDVRALGERFDLMFDAVFNHASAQGAWFAKFLAQQPGWETAFVTAEGDPDLRDVVRPRTLPLLTEFQTAAGPKKVWTTFSADQADINFSDPRMFLRILDVLLFYVANGARYLRLDAIAFLWKRPGTPCIHLPETHRVIQLMRAVLDETAPAVQLVTETNVPHEDNISYFGDGHNEAQMVYNFALPPLVFHTFRTGDATKLCAWARTLGMPSDRVTFFNFLASHDGIGVNPARGLLDPDEIDALVQTTLDHDGFVSHKNMPDGSQIPYELNISYFDALSDPKGGEPIDLQVGRFLAAHAIMFALRGAPGIYFHSLFGSRGDRAGAESSCIPRRINRKKLDATALETELNTVGSRRLHVFRGLFRLLEIRAACPAFDPFAPQEIPESDPGVVAILRGTPGSTRALCLANVTPTHRAHTIPKEIRGPWHPLTAGKETPYEAGATVPLGPYEIVWLSSDR